MSTFAQVVASLKSRAASQITMLPVYWDKDAKPTLPDEPTPFAFLMIDATRARIVGFGAGRGGNLYRTECRLAIRVLIPRDWGLEQHAAYAEHVAAAFRSYRDEHVSCFAAEPMPEIFEEGSSEEVQNYSGTLIDVPFLYDRVG